MCEDCGVTKCKACVDKDFNDYMGELKEKEQPACNIEDKDDCEACGS
tara:strand:- start:438 stop:578 length:141 start_codon:yes stop_codon:yes gene_type:complete